MVQFEKTRDKLFAKKNCHKGKRAAKLTNKNKNKVTMTD